MLEPMTYAMFLQGLVPWVFGVCVLALLVTIVRPRWSKLIQALWVLALTSSLAGVLAQGLLPQRSSVDVFGLAMLAWALGAWVHHARVPHQRN